METRRRGLEPRRGTDKKTGGARLSSQLPPLPRSWTLRAAKRLLGVCAVEGVRWPVGGLVAGSAHSSALPISRVPLPDTRLASLEGALLYLPVEALYVGDDLGEESTTNEPTGRMLLMLDVCCAHP